MNSVVLPSPCSQQNLLSSMLSPLLLFHVDAPGQQLVDPSNSQGLAVSPQVFSAIEQLF